MYPHVAWGEVRPYPCAWAHLDSPAPTRAGGPPNALQWGKCAHTLALGPTLPRPPPAAPTAPQCSPRGLGGHKSAPAAPTLASGVWPGHKCAPTAPAAPPTLASGVRGGHKYADQARGRASGFPLRQARGRGKAKARLADLRRRLASWPQACDLEPTGGAQRGAVSVGRRKHWGSGRT